MLLIFAAALGLTLLGIVVGFGRRGPLQDSSVVALYWGWYNMAILIAAIAVCIERPRLRRNERVRGSRPVTVVVAGRPQVFTTADISVDGMRLNGRVDAAVGAEIGIEIGKARLDGRIVRRTDREFAIEIKPGTAARAAMVRQVYSGGFETSVSRIRSGKVAGKVLARIFQ
jgi:cellulose synthase (UDP-forming)